MAPQVRALDYCNEKGLVIGAQLGFGVHGTVFSAENQAKTGRVAVKAHEGETGYRRERDVYLRLQERGVTAIGACAVPELLAYHDGLWVLEMTVVTRPFVLDFARAYLDHAPDFSEEVLDEWRTESRSNSANTGGRSAGDPAFPRRARHSPGRCHAEQHFVRAVKTVGLAL